MKHADSKLDTHTSPPSRACDAGRKVERCVVEVVASSLRGFAYSPPVLSSHANNSCKGDGRENERSSGKKAAQRERRGAYRRPRSTTVGIHCVGAEATPPRPLTSGASSLSAPTRARWLRLPPPPPRSVQPEALRPRRSELADHAASQSAASRSSPTALTGARRSATPPLEARGERWWWPLASDSRE